jgi:hypothetical protein
MLEMLLASNFLPNWNKRKGAEKINFIILEKNYYIGFVVISFLLR